MNHFIFCSLLAPGDGAAGFSQTNLLCTHFYRTSDSESKHCIFHFLSAEKKIMGTSPCPFIHMLHTCTNVHSLSVDVSFFVWRQHYYGINCSPFQDLPLFCLCLAYPDTHPHTKIQHGCLAKCQLMQAAYPMLTVWVSHRGLGLICALTKQPAVSLVQWIVKCSFPHFPHSAACPCTYTHTHTLQACKNNWFRED